VQLRYFGGHLNGRLVLEGDSDIASLQRLFLDDPTPASKPDQLEETYLRAADYKGLEVDERCD
jgi:hypothetical protein